MNLPVDALEQSRGTSCECLYEKVRVWIEEYRIGKRGPIHLLDLGCGSGNLLRMLALSGWSDLTGCDMMDFDEKSGGSDRPFRFIQADLNQRLPFEEGSFDVVTAVEVMEHLENPRQLVRDIFRLLRPGGLAIVTTPNNESVTSLLSLVLRGYFSSFAPASYPAHITPLLQIDLERIMNEAGFRGLEFSWSQQGRVPGLGIYWQQISMGMLKGKRFSDNMLARAKK